MYLLLFNVNGKRKTLLRCCYYATRKTAAKLAKVKTITDISYFEKKGAF